MTISCYLIHHRDVAESEHDHNYENYILSPDGTLVTHRRKGDH